MLKLKDFLDFVAKIKSMPDRIRSATAEDEEPEPGLLEGYRIQMDVDFMGVPNFVAQKYVPELNEYVTVSGPYGSPQEIGELLTNPQYRASLPEPDLLEPYQRGIISVTDDGRNLH